MDKIQIIRQPILKELEAFERLFEESLHSRIHDFQFMLDFILNKTGKKIRPLILILSAELCGKSNEKTLEYAVVLELLHTATLIHDDVVDNTMERRSQPSVNAEYDNKMAVLLGDYILSQAIIKGVNTENITILKIMAALSQNLAEGELAQMISSFKTVIDEEKYLEVIHKKTAVLISSCTEMGALSVNAPKEQVEALRIIGKNLGICFQIKDDLFDYFEQGEIGKPTGHDIKEGKITLPLIYALQNAPEEKAKEMMNIIDKQDFNKENIQILISFAKEYKGLEYAYAKMQKIKEDTLRILDQFPDSSSKESMINLIDYIIERKK